MATLFFIWANDHFITYGPDAILFMDQRSFYAYGPNAIFTLWARSHNMNQQHQLRFCHILQGRDIFFETYTLKSFTNKNERTLTTQNNT